MSIRTDLDKLLAYAKQQNIQVNIENRTATTTDAAVIDLDKQIIILYANARDPIKDLVVSLLHELTHLVGYRQNPQEYLEYFRVASLDKPTMKERYEIYKIERKDIKNMPIIALVLGLKTIKQETIKAWVRFDTWQYWYYYEFGKFPVRKERVKMLIKLGIKPKGSH